MKFEKALTCELVLGAHVANRHGASDGAQDGAVQHLSSNIVHLRQLVIAQLDRVLQRLDQVQIIILILIKSLNFTKLY